MIERIEEKIPQEVKDLVERRNGTIDIVNVSLSGGWMAAGYSEGEYRVTIRYRARNGIKKIRKLYISI